MKKEEGGGRVECLSARLHKCDRVLGHFEVEAPAPFRLVQSTGKDCRFSGASLPVTTTSRRPNSRRRRPDPRRPPPPPSDTTRQPQPTRIRREERERRAPADRTPPVLLPSIDRQPSRGGRTAGDDEFWARSFDTTPTPAQPRTTDRRVREELLQGFSLTHEERGVGTARPQYTLWKSPPR